MSEGNEDEDWLHKSFQGMQRLPRVGEGRLPQGDRWELRAGLIGRELHHWVTHAGGGGGGSVGLVMAQAETIGLAGCSHQAEIQIAVGQLAKHVTAVRAFDQQGKSRDAERLGTPDLPVDLFVAWTTKPGPTRIAAFDNDGESIGECEVPSWPPSPPTA